MYYADPGRRVGPDFWQALLRFGCVAEDEVAHYRTPANWAELTLVRRVVRYARLPRREMTATAAWVRRMAIRTSGLTPLPFSTLGDDVVIARNGQV